MERQLDLSSVAARLRGRPVLACPSQSLVSRTSSRGSCLADSTLARTLVLSADVLGEFPTEPVTREAHLYPHRLCYDIPCEALARSRETDSDQKFEMADRRDWGGGGDDPEESTQRMIERIWESLTDIQRRMDQQASVAPVVVPPEDGEIVPIALIPPGVEFWGSSLLSQ
ncbi:hypothetical protein Taro_040054 [Colocasia esculenta]|uniref:Uncharacterized protein n=1 Tax=Colocasia esculenta TaxID=4460 RepID=A0A843WAW0_COLES|nr:hypothetical protein [Colocasia esculenta]